MGYVHLGFHTFIETVASNVCDNTYDFSGNRVGAVEKNAASDWFLVREVALYKCFANNDGLRCVCCVAVSKHAAALHRDMHGAEVIRADDGVISNRFLAGFVRLASFNLET